MPPWISSCARNIVGRCNRLSCLDSTPSPRAVNRTPRPADTRVESSYDRRSLRYRPALINLPAAVRARRHAWPWRHDERRAPRSRREASFLCRANVFRRAPGASRSAALPRSEASVAREYYATHQARPPQTIRGRSATWIVAAALFAGLATWTDRGASGESRFRPSVTVSQEFSDNVDLDPEDEQSAFITSLTPGLSYRSFTSRFRGGFDGTIGYPVHHRRRRSGVQPRRRAHCRRRAAAGPRSAVPVGPGFDQPGSP
jgi:hypothetical protein